MEPQIRIIDSAQPGSPDAYYTVRELLREMETITKISYSGKYGHIITELTKSQLEILQAMKISPPDLVTK